MRNTTAASPLAMAMAGSASSVRCWRGFCGERHEAAGRHQPQRLRQQQHQQRADHEHRHREQQRGRRRGDAVEQAAAMERGIGAGRHADDDREQRVAAAISSSVRGRRSAISLDHRIVVDQRRAEIAAQRACAGSRDTARASGRSRPRRLAQLGDRGRVRRDAAGRQQQLGRIARHDVQRQEDDRGDEPRPGRRRSPMRRRNQRISPSEPGLFEHAAGGGRERAGQVGEALHALVHAVALRAPGEADQRHLLERGALHVLVDRDALGLVELGAAPRQQLRRCAAPARRRSGHATATASCRARRSARRDRCCRRRRRGSAISYWPRMPRLHARRPVGQLQLALDADGGEMLLHDLGGVLVHAELGGRRASSSGSRSARRPPPAAPWRAPDRSPSRLASSASYQGVPSTIGTPSSGLPRPKKATLTMSSRLTAWATARRTRASENGPLGAVEQDVHERPVTGFELEARVGLDRGHRLPRHVLDHVDVAGLQRGDAQVLVGIDDELDAAAAWAGRACSICRRRRARARCRAPAPTSRKGPAPIGSFAVDFRQTTKHVVVGEPGRQRRLRFLGHEPDGAADPESRCARCSGTARACRRSISRRRSARSSTSRRRR